jgi:hypothetical protein
MSEGRKIKVAILTCCLATVSAIIALAPVAASSAEVDSGGAARNLLQGCLTGPSKDGMARLAAATGATPYSEARIRRKLGPGETTTIVDDNTRPDEAQRTETSVTAFAGWDLPGPGAGSLEYDEGDYRMTRVEVASGQVIAPWRVARTRSCRVEAPVANARAIFELYERLQHEEYGILISADRRWVSVFTFDPDRYDIELAFQLDAPLAGLPVDTKNNGNSRLVLSDAGRRYSNDPGPGVPTVTLTRSALLSALNGPADMNFMNESIEPVVQRLSRAQI